MERLSYILDTNAVADYINAIQTTKSHIEQALQVQHRVYLCQPVHYEVLRGLLKVNATRKLCQFEQVFAPQLEWLPLTDSDWRQAVIFWVNSRKMGKQLSDVDLLIAAVTLRLDGVLVSADDDFDRRPVKRENWREDSKDH